MTTTSTYEELNTRAGELPDFTSAHPCPDYCNLPGHPADSIHDDPIRQSRGHGGPASEFGPYVSGGSTEFTHEPGVFHAVVWVDLGGGRDFDNPKGLLELAAHVAAGAEWLIKQQEAGA